jgi:hypothetical protein
LTPAAAKSPRVSDSSADTESAISARNARSVLAVDHAVTHYTVAVGPGKPGRHRAVIAAREDDSVFRLATDEEDVLRIAAEVGVSAAQTLWNTGVITAAAPDRVPDAVPDRAPDPVPDRAPDAVPDRAPDAVPDRAPDAVPDRAPEAVPDRAPDAGLGTGRRRR